MLEWTYRNFAFEPDLQIIHADVRIVWDGEIWVEEPLCIDVGLPALALSMTENTTPNRFADPSRDWRQMPFLSCGCGDPDCRAFSFAVEHLTESTGRIRLTLLEERQGKAPRELSEAELDLESWKSIVLAIANDFLQFVDGLPYKPLQAETVAIVRELTEKAALS